VSDDRTAEDEQAEDGTRPGGTGASDGAEPSSRRPATAAARRERRATGEGRSAPAGKATRDRPGTRDEDRDGAARGGRPAGRAAAKAGSGTAPAARTAERGRTGTARSTAAQAAGKGAPTRERDQRGRRVSLIRRLIRFIREVVAELRKVIWPTRKELITYTGVVLVFLVVMITVVGLLDLAFAKGVFWIFG
jgi:preprotein translocase subunit SecE